MRALFLAYLLFSLVLFLARGLYVRLIQSGARSLAEYAQQVGRGGRDGEDAYCLCFYNPSDSQGIRRSIESAVLTTSTTTALMRKVAERTTERGPTSFLHWADFHRAGIDDDNTDAVLAALCRTGLALVGKRQLARIFTMKRTRWSIQPLPALCRFSLVPILPCVRLN